MFGESFGFGFWPEVCMRACGLGFFWLIPIIAHIIGDCVYLGKKRSHAKSG